MHQTMKKVWAVLLVLCMLLGVVPFGAQAALLDGGDYITQQLSLGEDLVLHLRASLPERYEDLAKDAVGTLTYAGKTTTYTMNDLTPDANGMYDMPVEMAVAQMTDDIHAVIKAKVLGINQEIINEHYSIRGYLETIIEGDYSQTTKDLCLELLNMGAWAQLYFNYNISDLANKNYSISPAYSVPEEIPVVKPTGSVEGITLYGATVRLLSKTAVRFYFDADNGVDGYTFTINGAEVQPVAKDDLWYIEATGIGPQIMSNELAVEVTDGTSTLSFGYAPIWYFTRTYNKTEDEYTKALMEAAYSYYKTAENYKTQICMDLEISTLSGNFESIGLGFYPLDFEGDINNYTDRIEVPTGTTYTVKLDQGKYLVDGEFKGIGVTVLGGPTWDATLEDGTYDRHNIQISDLRLEGPEDRSIDLTLATIAKGKVDTGYENASDGGIATVADGVISITNGFFTDGYKITFNEVDTYLCLDMNFTTLGNSTDQIDVRFYTYGFEDDINNQIDRTYITAGTTTTVKLDAEKYLIDGEIPGIGVAIFGGPAWDTQLEDGTYDRHNFTISNIRLEGEVNQAIDLSRASVKSGFANANSGGISAVADGIISATNGYMYDGHMITFVDESIPEETEPEVSEPETTEPETTEPEETVPPVEEYDTTLSLDVKLDTISGTWEKDIEIRFYNYNYEGNPHETYTDSLIFKAGEQQTVKLDAAKYLIDGELTGIGIGIFGGPEWNTAISDGVYDRHIVTISNVKLEGEQIKTYDLSKSTMISGTGDTGYTTANGSGVGAFVDGVYQITNGFCYDCHKISLVEDTNTYIVMDLQLDTVSGTWANPIDIRFCNNSQTDSVHTTYTDKIHVTVGEKVTVKLNAEKYLVDGQLPGFSIGIFGGPEWNTQISDGVYDRHSVVISDLRLEGVGAGDIDLSTATVSTGIPGSNAGGTIAIVDDQIVISNGFCYDGHKITLADQSAEEPPVEDTTTYLNLDLLFTTLGGSTDPVDIGFYPYNFEGDINDWTDKLTVTAGTTANIQLDASKYLVDGEITGIGFAIFGGPAWDAKLPDGYTPDRHTITISNACLSGYQSKAFDLSQSVWANGTNGTGYTNANGSGAATVGQSIVITNGFQYDGHKISLVEDTSTYIEMDLMLTTLGGATEPIEVRFCNYGQTDSVHTTYTNNLQVTPGTKVSVKFKVDEYLVDGQLPGFGIAIFGGPEWNTQISDGVYDRHSVVISNLRLTGVDARDIDLSTATVAVGIPGSNSGGQIAIVDGEIVITGGFRYDGHLITF